MGKEQACQALGIGGWGPRASPNDCGGDTVGEIAGDSGDLPVIKGSACNEHLA